MSKRNRIAEDKVETLAAYEMEYLEACDSEEYWAYLDEQELEDRNEDMLDRMEREYEARLARWSESGR